MWRNHNNREDRGTEGPVLRDPKAMSRLRDGPYSFNDSRRGTRGRGRGNFNNWNQNNNGSRNFNRNDRFGNEDQPQVNVWGSAHDNNQQSQLFVEAFPPALEESQFPIATAAVNTMPFFQQQIPLLEPPPAPPLLQSTEFGVSDQIPSLLQLFQQHEQQRHPPPPPPPPLLQQPPQIIPSLFSQAQPTLESGPFPLMSLVTGRVNSQSASNVDDATPPQEYSDNYEDNEPPWYADLEQQDNQGKKANPFTWELPSNAQISESETKNRDSPWYSGLLPDKERDKAPKWHLQANEIRMKPYGNSTPPTTPKVPEIVANPLFKSSPIGYTPTTGTGEPLINHSFQRDSQLSKIERNPRPSPSSYMGKSQSAIPSLMDFSHNNKTMPPFSNSDSNDRFKTNNRFNNHDQQNSNKESQISWNQNSQIRPSQYGGSAVDDPPELEQEHYPSMQSSFESPTFDRDRQQQPPSVVNRLMNMAQGRDGRESSPNMTQGRGGAWQTRGRGEATLAQRGGGAPSRGMGRQSWANQEMGSQQDWGDGGPNREMNTNTRGRGSEGPSRGIGRQSWDVGNSNQGMETQGWDGGNSTQGMERETQGWGPSRGIGRPGWDGENSNQGMERETQGWGPSRGVGRQGWDGENSNQAMETHGWGGGRGAQDWGGRSGEGPNRGMGPQNRGVGRGVQGRGGGGPNRGMNTQSRVGGELGRGMHTQNRGSWGQPNRGIYAHGRGDGVSGRGMGMQRGRGGGITGSRQEQFSAQNMGNRKNNPLLPTPKLIPYPPPPRTQPVDRNPRGILKPDNKYNNFVGGGFVDYSPEKKSGVVSYDDDDDEDDDEIEYLGDLACGTSSGAEDDNHHDFFSTKMVQHFASLLKGKSVEDQLEELMTHILLPPEYLTTRVGIVRNLHVMLTEKYNKCKLHPYGADFIGIGSSDDSVNVFVDLTGKQGSCTSITAHNIEPSDLTKEAVDELLKHIQTGENHAFFGQIVKRTNFGRINLPVISFMHSDSKVRCNIRLENYFIVQEAKVIQFVNSLDTRVSPILAIIRYWSSVHKVLDTPEEDTRNRFITLLVLFFLARKKIIPTMAHLQSLCVKQEYFENVDIGFCDDHSLVPRNENSVLEDKNIFTLSVLALLKEFFNLFAVTNLKDEVVSMWKSELIPKDNFLPDVEGKLLPPDLRKRYRYGVNGKLKERRLDCGSKLCIQDFQDLTENLSLAIPDYDVSKFQIECVVAKERLENLMINGSGCIMDLFVVTDYNNTT